MTAIFDKEITHPMAWVGSDFKSKEEIVFELSAKQTKAFEDILVKVKDIARDDITLEHASHPLLDDDLKKVYNEVCHGRGIQIVRGMPVDGYSIEEIEKIYRSLCVHFGTLLSNNAFGHKMVKVMEERATGGQQSARGTKSNAELAMHNDSGDVFMLMFVQQALSGGESQFSSGPAAHNTIRRTRPDLLPILYKGFPQHRRKEQQPGQDDVTPYDIPVFAIANQPGLVSTNFTYSSIVPAMHFLGRTLTAQEEEALELMRVTLLEQQLELRMAPGEVSVANNYAMCHSRSNFVDGEDDKQRRLVLRVWTEVPNKDRLLPLGREYFLMENAGGRLGYDPVPGLDGAIGRGDYNGMTDELAAIIKATQAKPKVGAGA